MPSPSTIEPFFRRVARRHALVQSGREIGLFAGGLSLSLLALLLTADLLPPNRTSGIVASVIIALATIGLAYRIGVRIRRLGDPRRVAQLVGSRFSGLRSDLISVVELTDDLDSDRPSRFSIVMYEALVRQTCQRLAGVSPQAITPRRRLRPAAILLSAGAITWAFVATLAPDRLSHGATNLLAGSAGATDVAPRPLLGDLRLTYIYPAYIRRPQRTIDSSTGHVSAPLGTRVQLDARALAPMVGAEIVVSRGRAQRRRELEQGPRRRLKGELKVTGDGGYHFEVRTIDGRTIRDPVRHRIDVEPDRTPRVTLHGHPDGTEITARQRVEVGFTAEDDHGLREVKLAYRVAGRKPKRITIWRPAANRTEPRARAGGKTDWDLAKLDLRPGTRLAYWIEAFDNDTVSGPKRGRSATAFLAIYSPEDRHRRILRQQGQVVEQALGLLADRLLLFAEGGEPLEPRLRLERARLAHRSQSHLLDNIRELRNRMREHKLFPDAAFRVVGAIRRRLGGLTGAERRLLRELKARRASGGKARLARLRGHNAKTVIELERDTLLLADLLHEQQLQSLLGAAQRLKDARQRLADLLARYRKERDPRLRDELLREISYMKSQLQQLLARMAKLQQRIPDEYLNLEAIKTVKLGQSLQQLSAALGAGDNTRVDRALKALDRDLAQLQQLLGGNLSGYRAGRMAKREQAFGKLLDRLRGLEEEQRRIGRRTSRLVERYRRKAAQVLKSRITPFINRQQARLRRLRREVDEIDNRSLPSYQREQLARIKKRVSGLREMLKQRDVAQALDMAQRVHNGLRTLRDDLVEDEAHYGGHDRARARRTLRHTRRARAMAAELERELEAIFPEPRSLLSTQDRKQLAELRRAQQRLRRGGEQLAKELAKRPPGSVGLPRVPRGLQDAGRLMQRATGRLAAVKPQQARSHQRAAADRLASLQRQLRRSRKPRASGRAPQRERVKIPGAEAFAPPREFREDILEAMKESAPRSFESQVKRYYEDLVR